MVVSCLEQGTTWYAGHVLLTTSAHRVYCADCPRRFVFRQWMRRTLSLSSRTCGERWREAPEEEAEAGALATRGTCAFGDVT